MGIHASAETDAFLIGDTALLVAFAPSEKAIV